MATLSAAAAKANWAASLRQVEQGGMLVITRYGQPVAALVGIEEVAQLARPRARSPKDGLVGLVHRWDDSDDLAVALDQLDRQSERSLPNLD